MGVQLPESIAADIVLLLPDIRVAASFTASARKAALLRVHSVTLPVRHAADLVRLPNVKCVTFKVWLQL